MANIFHLNPAGAVPRDERSARPTADCEIILFPGVRYERWADTPPPAQQQLPALRKSRTKKRALEMAD